MDFSNFENIFDIIESSKQNIFLTGKAGTGKSSFLEFCKQKTSKRSIVLAPTGVSALNVKGQTIHSFFKFKTGFIDVDREESFSNKRKKLYQNIDLLIIDEISMVRADIFSAIEKFLRLHGPNKGEFFGGVQLLVIGDMYQLPPVVSYKEKEIFYSHYNTAFFFSSEAFLIANFKIIELQTVYRQTESDFIEVLNEIRGGNNDKTILNFINKAYDPLCLKEEFFFTILTAKKDQALEINNNKLKELETEEYYYQGEVEGNFTTEESRMPAPLYLYLKIGTKVMFIKNDSEKKWVNGTLGTIIGLSEKAVEVQVEKNGYIKNFSVKRSQWDNINYSYDLISGKIKEEVLGSYKQFPLIHAWAITIHKSQGKTLDGAIIDIGNKVFSPGQLYVALSRCSSWKNVKLASSIKPSDIKCDFRIINFFKEQDKNRTILTL